MSERHFRNEDDWLRSFCPDCAEMVRDRVVGRVETVPFHITILQCEGPETWEMFYRDWSGA